MTTIKVFIFVVAVVCLSACDLIEPRSCNEVFLSITLEVSGDTLDQTYTIRTQTGDTVRQSTSPSFDSGYTVLDDSYQEELEGEEADFRFYGYRNDTLLVDEPYVLGADECHVYKVSGKDKINL